MMGADIHCNYCGRTFRPKQHRQRFCCDWCRKTAFDLAHGRLSVSPKRRARRARQKAQKVVGNRRGTTLPKVVGIVQKTQVKTMNWRGTVGPFRGRGIEAGPVPVDRRLWRAILSAEFAGVPLVPIPSPSVHLFDAAE